MKLVLSLLIFLLIANMGRSNHSAQRYEKLAPYSGVRWASGVTEVLVDGTWYGLVSIDTVTEADLVRFAKSRFGERWQKRIGEDLVEVMTTMKAPPGDKVDLVLADLTSGARIDRKGVAMTKEKRQAVWTANRSLRPGKTRPKVAADRTPAGRVDRPHRAEPDPAFEYLAHPLRTDDAEGAVWLTRDEAQQDLDELEWLLSTRYSYWRMKGVDAQAAFDAVRSGIDEKIERRSFAIQVMKLLALFGDGHTRLIESETRTLPAGYAPFLVGSVGERVVPLLSDRSDLVDPDLHYLVAIDGRPLSDWLAVAARMRADGSAQFVRRQALRNLRYLQYLRRELGLKETSDVQLKLQDEAGESSTITLRVSTQKPIYGAWPRTTEHRRLEGDVGYLRIAAMESDPGFLRGLTEAMELFRKTEGLIIDVRGNGGGSRDALRVLFPYFMAPGDPPHVANVAAYRLTPDDVPGAAEGYLDNRALFPASSERWGADERRAIEACAAGFKPGWTPPKGEFSDWHYMLLTRPEEGDVHPYEKPVIVLMNGDCFSATDIFLGAFKGRPNVTLLGESSGGGSGRSQGLALANSGLRLRASTMASFRPDGSLYDGHGIEPDVVVRPVPTDFIGTTDTQLAAALARLSER